MIPATILNWLRSNELERRRVIAIMICGLAIQAITMSSQRALFMSWGDADHPLVSPSASAFFARAPSPPGASNASPTYRFASTVGRPSVRGIGRQEMPTGVVNAVDLAPSATVVGDVIPDGIPTELSFRTISLPATTGGNGPGTSPPGAIGAPAAFDLVAEAVPETETWLMMIIGFGLVGAAARRARRLRLSAKR